MDEGDSDWTLATFDGLRRRQHAEFKALSLREKIRVLEEMEEVAQAMRRVGTRRPL